ncbi:translation initiation factor [Robiginitalea aurantiaca]|uniref:Translation initiation factor n=1 Tax=Robiginitalea aurantiaca TaxID=3056915 RepID=A0ABT7WFI6_9FLAO|nr:translation initiation factor [Robiginitalea aurantiaca]MDM9631683.1 translation initiation factor [Robiginitalea aurantiaca]
MDLKDQLKNLFPDHEESDQEALSADPHTDLWIQQEPILCKYEKRKGKPVTVLEGYTGAAEDFKKLARQLKQHLGVGGSSKNETILIQGDYRDQIMEFLRDLGFKVKRVGG